MTFEHLVLVAFGFTLGAGVGWWRCWAFARKLIHLGVTLDRWSDYNEPNRQARLETPSASVTAMRLSYVFAFLLLSSSAFAQSPATPTSGFGWNQVAQSLAVAQGYQYQVEIDNVLVPTPLTVTCTGTASPFSCTAGIPPVTPGDHTARLRTVDVSVPSSPLASPFSTVLSFNMRAVPATATDFGIVPLPPVNP